MRKLDIYEKAQFKRFISVMDILMVTVKSVHVVDILKSL